MIYDRVCDAHKLLSGFIIIRLFLQCICCYFFLFHEKKTVRRVIVTMMIRETIIKMNILFRLDKHLL
jgi:hypothetical protein